MTEQRASRWEPTEAEIDAAVRATDGYLTDAEAEAVLRNVSPLIAARALREAVDAMTRSDAFNVEACRFFMRVADELAPRGFQSPSNPKEGAA